MDHPDGVEENSEGLWEVFVGGKIVARVKTNADAWREYERAVHELRSRAEALADWISRQ